jgi:hypothetical protein
MRGRSRHPLSSTRGADPTTPARKGDSPIFPACVAPQPKKTSGKNAAIEKGAKFRLNETRDLAILFPAARQKCFQFPGNDGVEQGLFRAAGFIAGRDCHEGNAKARRAPTRRLQFVGKWTVTP